jgi:hypothetical protein
MAGSLAFLSLGYPDFEDLPVNGSSLGCGISLDTRMNNHYNSPSGKLT